jgi:hypothetical protein
VFHFQLLELRVSLVLAVELADVGDDRKLHLSAHLAVLDGSDHLIAGVEYE